MEQCRDGVVVITGDAGTWYPVRGADGMANLDTELEVRSAKLAKAHIAAKEDYLDWRYGPVAEPSRIERVVRVLRSLF